MSVGTPKERRRTYHQELGRAFIRMVNAEDEIRACQLLQLGLDNGPEVDHPEETPDPLQKARALARRYEIHHQNLQLDADWMPEVDPHTEYLEPAVDQMETWLTETGASLRRPLRTRAEQAIRGFLADELPDGFPLTLIENGNEDRYTAPNKCGWAFWVLDDDTTSYLKEDLTVEWYGTAYTGEEP